MLKWILMGVTGLLVLAFWVVEMREPTDLLLVAHEIVPIYESERDAVRSPASSTNRQLKPSERVQVIKCIDVKHYLIYKVRFSDGATGFINDGNYALERRGSPASC